MNYLGHPAHANGVSDAPLRRYLFLLKGRVSSRSISLSKLSDTPLYSLSLNSLCLRTKIDSNPNPNPNCCRRRMRSKFAFLWRFRVVGRNRSSGGGRWRQVSPLPDLALNGFRILGIVTVSSFSCFVLKLFELVLG